MSSELNSIKNAFDQFQLLLWNPETTKENVVSKDHLSKIDVGIQNLMKSEVLGEAGRNELGAVYAEYQKLIQLKDVVTERDLDPISTKVQKIRNKLLEGKRVSQGSSHLEDIKEDALKDPVKHTYTDVAREVFSFLDATDLESCGIVNKEWQKAAGNPALQKKVFLNSFVFGKEKWNTYFGDVGAEPPLPPNLEELLTSECPYFPDKRVFQTHMLVLIPKIIDGKPYNLNSLVELVEKDPKTGQKTGFSDIWEKVLEEHGNASVKESQWVLMTKDVIPESRNKSYAAQRSLVARDLNYRVPTLLEAATCILVEHLKTGIRRFSSEEDMPWHEWTYTRCQEAVGGYQTVVGGFFTSGLIVDRYHSDYQVVGVAALRKL